MKNIAENYKVIVVKPISEEIVTDSADIDCEQYLDDGLATLMVGSAEDAGATLDVVILGSKDGGSTYPDTLATFEQVLDTDDGKSASIGFNIGEYNRLQVSWTIAGGSSPVFTFGVSILVNTPVDASGTNTGDLS
jgi:hypothetical protein